MIFWSSKEYATSRNLSLGLIKKTRFAKQTIIYIEKCAYFTGKEHSHVCLFSASGTISR